MHVHHVPLFGYNLLWEVFVFVFDPNPDLTQSYPHLVFALCILLGTSSDALFYPPYQARKILKHGKFHQSFPEKKSKMENSRNRTRKWETDLGKLHSALVNLRQKQLE